MFNKTQNALLTVSTFRYALKELNKMRITKYLFATVVFIALSFQLSYSQNCEKIGNDAITYLKLHYEKIDTAAEDISFLTSIGKCYLISENGRKALKEFEVSDELKTRDPGLILLVINSRSMKESKERQYWLNLYGLMTRPQIKKLYGILSREFVKLKLIDDKYDKKRIAIKKKYLQKWEQMDGNKSRFDILVLGINKRNDEFSVYKYNNGKFHDFQIENNVCSFEDLILITPQTINTNEFLIKKHSDRTRESFILDFKENLLAQKPDSIQYIKKLLTDNFDEKSTLVLNEYYISYWVDMIEYFDQDRNKMSQYEQLLNLEFEDLAVSKSKGQDIVNKKEWKKYTFYSNTRNYKKACVSLKKLLDNKQYLLKSPHNFAFSLYDLVIFGQNEDCKACISDIEKHIINNYEIEKDVIAEKLDKDVYINFATHLLLFDFYIEYGQSDRIKSIARKLKSSSKDKIFGKEDKFAHIWYFNLNNLFYLDEFKKGSSLKDINSQAYSWAKKSNTYQYQDVEALRMEYLCYYALFQIINDKKFKAKNLLDILNEVIRLGENPSLPTYSYVEKHIASYIFNALSAEGIDDEGPQIILIGESIKKTSQDSIRIQGAITDESGINRLSINGKYIYIKQNYFKSDFVLEIGENTFKLLAEDSKGNITTKEIKIERIRVNDPFMERKDYALIFASDKYDNWSNLANPILDAQAIKKELEENYGFEVQLVLNPTRKEFQKWLFRYAEKDYGEYDQLLIFFTGHGDYEPKQKLGYLVFKDSKSSSIDYFRDTYFPLVTFKQLVDNINCDHIFLLLDACHSGTIDAKISSRELIKGEDKDKPLNKGNIDFLKSKLKFKSRPYLTSVGNLSSSDGEKGQHSPFARGILSVLRDYGTKNDILTYETLISSIQTIKTSFSSEENSDKNSGDDYSQYGKFGNEDPGSSFFFIRK